MTNATMDVLLSNPHPMSAGRPLCTATSHYALARRRARHSQFWSILTGRSRSLFELGHVREVCAVQDKSDAGIRTVPISQIRGSEGRSRYFDRDFDPLHDQARGRWLSIAKARQQGKELPPVVLVQVGDIYFVKDGHHRISVARALGQSYVEARVTIWPVTGPLPWETAAQITKHGLASQLLGVVRAFKERQVRDQPGSLGLSRNAPTTSDSVAGA